MIIYEYGLIYWIMVKNKFIKLVLYIDDIFKILGLFIIIEDILCLFFIFIVFVYKKNKVLWKIKFFN